MILLPGFQEGLCISHDEETWTRFEESNMTECECDEYCKFIPKTTACEYIPKAKRCLGYTHPAHFKREKGSNFRCQIFEENNNNAWKKTSKSNTPGSWYANQTLKN